MKLGNALIVYTIPRNNEQKSTLENIKGAVIIPDLTKHKDIVEFIAPIHLKSELKINDGDKLKIELIE